MDLSNFLLLKNIIHDKALNKSIYYLANPGNYGDGLIREGTLDFFKEIGLEYRELYLTKSRDFPRGNQFHWRRSRHWKKACKNGGLLIFGGGGAWCHLWDHSKIVETLANAFEVIVLPSTYEKRYAIDNVTFFRRDEEESKVSMPKSIFCHDMAFYLSKRTFTGSSVSSGIGYFFRSDAESAGQVSIPDNNRDISTEGNSLTPVQGFINAISSFHEIHTDRLHVSIAAALLNKKVHLYAGSYFKNKAVFKASLKPYFKNIKFHL